MKTAPQTISQILHSTEDPLGAFGVPFPSAEQVVLKIVDELLMELEIYKRHPDRWSRWELWALRILRESHKQETGTAVTATLSQLFKTYPNL